MSVEIYSAGRYFALTGNVYNGTSTISEAHQAYLALIQKIMPYLKKPKARTHAPATSDAVASDPRSRKAQAKTKSKRKPAKKIGHPDREPFLFRRGCSMRAYGAGAEEEEIFLELKELYDECCEHEPPKDDTELRKIAQRCCTYPKGDGKKAEIDVTQTYLNPQHVDAADEAMTELSDQLRIFQRAGEVMHVVELEEAQREREVKLTFPAGTVMLIAVRKTNLIDTFERNFRFIRKTIDPIAGEVTVTIVECPTKLAATYLDRTPHAQLTLPVITGTILTPVMRRDGTILDAAGYDAKTGLFFLKKQEWPKIPEFPTRSDAVCALDILMLPFAQFPFESLADYSAHLSVVIATIQRRLIDHTPLACYTARHPRTGKSKLAESVAIIATGIEATAMPFNGNQDELRKAITATLYKGLVIMNIDNIEGVLASPDLNRALTQTTYGDRILGLSKMLELPTLTQWTATGNNLEVKGDLTSRSLMISIDAQMERPETRTFEIEDFESYLKQHRQELVAAALTILRAYHVAGRPPQRGKRWGGFDEWSQLIRAALIWVGCEDPCLTREIAFQSDPDRQAMAQLFEELYGVYQGTTFLLQDLRKEFDAGNLLDPLKEALLDVAQEKEEIAVARCATDSRGK